MKRFTRKQRSWLLVRLNKIAQLKKDCIECNRDNIRLTAENNALRTSDNAKASRIVIDQRLIHLGMFENKEDAAHAYDIAAVYYWGSFAQLNFTN